MKSNFVFKTRRFPFFFQIRLENGHRSLQGHWKWYHSTDLVWFPISVP